MLKIYLVSLCLLMFTLAGCSQDKPSGVSPSGIQVVTTLFPLYDMARAVGGSKADVRLLVPPGVEPHNFEPRPDDIISVNKAALFIYTNRYMEPWAEKLVKGVASERTKVVDSSVGLKLNTAIDAHRDSDGHEKAGAGHKGRDSGMDPHVWLDLENAVKMLDTILAAYIVKDPVNRSYYEANAASYRGILLNMDRRYVATFASCRNRTLMHAGHYAFGYLARRYGLEYLAATGVTADSEPTPVRLAELVKQVRALGVKVIFTEELVSPKLAETLADETGASIAKLHAGHNISRDELSKGVTFPDLMEQNLVVLAKGLQCSQ
jgi:zinc transport system substrate-binding protein